MADRGRGALPGALEQRIALLEDRSNEGDDLKRRDWLVLLLGCIVCPALLVLWGASG